MPWIGGRSEDIDMIVVAGSCSWHAAGPGPSLSSHVPTRGHGAEHKPPPETRGMSAMHSRGDAGATVRASGHTPTSENEARGWFLPGDWCIAMPLDSSRLLLE